MDVNGLLRARARRVAAALILALAGLCVRASGHGDFHDQILTINAQIAQTPANAELWLRRGELHHAHGDWEAARADYDKVTQLDPRLAVVDLARGRLFLQTGALTAAEEALDRFIAAHPQSAAGLVTRARVKRRLGAIEEAVADYDQAITFATQPEPDYYLERAELIASRGAEGIDRAIRGLDEGLARLGEPVTLALAAIELEVGAARYDAAIERIDVICSRTPRKELWLVRRGEVLEKAGRGAEARAAYRAAVAAIDALPEQRRRTKMMVDLRSRLTEKTSDPPAN